MFVCLFNVMPASLGKLYQVFQIDFCQKQLIHVGALCYSSTKSPFTSSNQILQMPPLTDCILILKKTTKNMQVKTGYILSWFVH